jgi:hypothetical protein
VSYTDGKIPSVKQLNLVMSEQGRKKNSKIKGKKTRAKAIYKPTLITPE